MWRKVVSKILNAKTRAVFISDLLLCEFNKILEIGPLNRPLLVGKNVKYFDLATTTDLRNKADCEGLDSSTVPNIDFFDPNGDLSGITERFDAVVSAHVLEHQPDLVRHLRSISNLLNPGGIYALIVPDSRYCFDHHLTASNLSSIVRAYKEARKKPDVWSLIEHRALTCHNDPVRHWAGDSGDPLVNLKERWDAAEQEFKNAGNSYLDVHCWQFTPDSLVTMVRGLRMLGLIDFEVVQVHDTPQNDLEFCGVLQKSYT
jgi:SAM-dependent methyltransferase